MTRSQGNSKKMWQTIGGIILLLLVVGYHFSRPTLEQWTGMSLPALDGGEPDNAPDIRQEDPGQEDDTPTVGESSSPSPALSSQSTPAGSEKSDTNESRSGTSENRKGPNRSAVPPPKKKFALKEIGRDRWLSPAGLVYAMGPRREHRIDHVMRHTRDDPGKPVHGVFYEREREEILKTLDRAYLTIKKKGLRPSSQDRGRTEFVVNMGTVIGYKGGQAGRRKKQKLNRLKLVLQDGNEVVTAFPY